MRCVRNAVVRIMRIAYIIASERVLKMSDTSWFIGINNTQLLLFFSSYNVLIIAINFLFYVGYRNLLKNYNSTRLTRHVMAYNTFIWSDYNSVMCTSAHGRRVFFLFFFFFILIVLYTLYFSRSRRSTYNRKKIRSGEAVTSDSVRTRTYVRVCV